MVDVHARSFPLGRDTDTSIWYLVAALALFVALAGVFTGAVGSTFFGWVYRRLFLC